ncbi:MAG: bifunctional folylpolyglutamate synthase/dihydrofolate synthase [Planctomycetia bacterium]|nr:bifunctional folylpolyglutamate synthase/dihydrofolate synthase [Planctomycetia bacterium]
MTAKREDRARPSRAEALAWLDLRLNYERQSPSPGTFGLGRMRRLLAAVGSPHDFVPVVHVAGTKGKGSTAAMIAAALGAGGYRVGRYLSPHVHAIEERIGVDGRPIDGRSLTAAFAVVMPAVEALDRIASRRGCRGPTWFEVLTAVALVHFARVRVDVAVMETGLGGRLDATNVTRPVLSVITSISLDHMALLGGTIGKIAAEKAGIIKRGVPVVSGAVHPSARRVIRTFAARRRAPLLELGHDFTAAVAPAERPVPGDPLGATTVRIRLPAGLGREDGGDPVYRIGMPGRHQADNAALAVVATLRLRALGYAVPERGLAKALRRTSLPARIEVVGTRPLVVVDAAHNVASMRALVDTLSALLDRLRPRVLVFAASADKQIERMLRVAAGRFDHVVVTRYATNPRAASVDRLARACRAAGLPDAEAADSPDAAVARARRLAGTRGVVCIAGSFFLAAEAGLA